MVVRELAAKRQEIQALVQEMECTAEAFEEVQEQNLRLLQQIRQKDDANFKVNVLLAVCGECFLFVCKQVISERIKASSMQKLLMEEKELLHSQISNLSQEKNRSASFTALSLSLSLSRLLAFFLEMNVGSLRMAEVMGRLEERDRNQEATLSAMEKDIALKQQAIDALKKKVGHGSATNSDVFVSGSGKCADSSELAACSRVRGERERGPAREGERETRGERESGSTAEEVSVKPERR